MARILVAGLNPAWQKVLEFADFRPGAVNRARNAWSLASGKGFNAAKVLRRLGHEVWLLQILGGDNGRRCGDACESLGIHGLNLWVGGETRQCLTLLHGNLADTSGESTEIIEPFRVEEAGAGPALMESLPSDPAAFDGLAVCGSIPPGVGEGVYAELLARFRPRSSVVDSWQGLSAASLAAATCVKMNRSEYRALEERLGPGGIGDALFLLTSGGGEASVLRGGRVQAKIGPPRLEAVANSIGAGDTVTAGTLHHLLLGLDPVEAFRRGLAMGSASCLNPLPAEYSEEDFRRLLPMTEVLP
jgi:1-phosphofructokinase